MLKERKQAPGQACTLEPRYVDVIIGNASMKLPAVVRNLKGDNDDYLVVLDTNYEILKVVGRKVREAKPTDGFTMQVGSLKIKADENTTRLKRFVACGYDWERIPEKQAKALKERMDSEEKERRLIANIPPMGDEEKTPAEKEKKKLPESARKRALTAKTETKNARPE